MIIANYLTMGADKILLRVIIPDAKALIARSNKIKFEVKLLF